MKREEFFEALSDIDENIVAAAKKEENAVSPTIVTAPKKKFKPAFATAAACVLLAAGIITIFAVNSLNLPSEQLPPATNNSTNENMPIENNSGYKTTLRMISQTFYPQTSLWVYTGDYSELEMLYNSQDYKNSYNSYDELAEQSSLVVAGTFTGDSMQIADLDESSADLNVKPPIMSYNTFKVEKVLKSNYKVWEGDEITIGMPYIVYDWDGAADTGRLYSYSNLTPMIRGDSWVFFLQYRPDYAYVDTINGCNNVDYNIEEFAEGAYYPVHDYEGRYPVPGKENKPFEYVDNNNGVVSPAVFNEGIYNELKERIAAYDRGEIGEFRERASVEVKYKNVIDVLAELGLKEIDTTQLCVEFVPEEFDGTAFRYENAGLYVSERGDFSDKKCLIGGGTGICVNLNLYLCDLNNDGKREICTSVSFGSGIVSSHILVFDYANDKTYTISDRMKYDYFLQENNGVLEYVCYDFPYYSNEQREYTTGVLTLDIMEDVSGNEEDASQTAPSTEDNPEAPSENVFTVMDLKLKNTDNRDIPIVFDMEQFPEYLFEIKCDEGTLTARKDDAVYDILIDYSCITSVYLCDLNGDGIEEIVAGVILKGASKGVDTEEKSVMVIDLAKSESYLLSNELNYTYTLEIKDNDLYVTKSEVGSGNEVTVNKLSAVYAADTAVNTEATGIEPTTTKPTETNPQRKVTMTLVNTNEQEGTAIFEIINITENVYYYNSQYDYLEQYKDDKWTKMEPINPMIRDVMVGRAEKLQAGGSVIFIASVKAYFGELPTGKYRIALSLATSEEELTVYGEFEVN